MSADGEIIFPADISKVVWDRLCRYPDLIHGWQELNESFGGNYSAKTKAKLITLFQVIGFGDDGKHARRYGSKLGRNEFLAGINPNILCLMIEDEPQTLVLNCGNDQVRIPLGYASGYAVVYPLNSLGTRLYLENRLAPFEFREQHLLGEQDFKCAEMVFVGGALYLPMLPDLVNREHFIEPDCGPLLLFELLWSQTLRFLPTRTTVDYNGSAVTLRAEGEYQLPIIATAFCGKGYGEHFARSIGFVRDKYAIDQASEDRRYIFDLNELNRSSTDMQRRIDLLKSWGFYLRWIPGHKTERIGILRAVAKLERSNG